MAGPANAWCPNRAFRIPREQIMARDASGPNRARQSRSRGPWLWLWPAPAAECRRGSSSRGGAGRRLPAARGPPGARGLGPAGIVVARRGGQAGGSPRNRGAGVAPAASLPDRSPVHGPCSLAALRGVDRRPRRFLGPGTRAVSRPVHMVRAFRPARGHPKGMPGRRAGRDCLEAAAMNMWRARGGRASGGGKGAADPEATS